MWETVVTNQDPQFLKKHSSFSSVLYIVASQQGSRSHVSAEGTEVCNRVLCTAGSQGKSKSVSISKSLQTHLLLQAVKEERNHPVDEIYFTLTSSFYDCSCRQIRQTVTPYVLSVNPVITNRMIWLAPGIWRCAMVSVCGKSQWEYGARWQNLTWDLWSLRECPKSSCCTQLSGSVLGCMVRDISQSLSP